MASFTSEPSAAGSGDLPDVIMGDTETFRIPRNDFELAVNALQSITAQDARPGAQVHLQNLANILDFDDAKVLTLSGPDFSAYDTALTYARQHAPAVFYGAMDASILNADQDEDPDITEISDNPTYRVLGESYYKALYEDFLSDDRVKEIKHPWSFDEWKAINNYAQRRKAQLQRERKQPPKAAEPVSTADETERRTQG